MNKGASKQNSQRFCEQSTTELTPDTARDELTQTCLAVFSQKAVTGVNTLLEHHRPLQSPISSGSSVHPELKLSSSRLH